MHQQMYKMYAARWDYTIFAAFVDFLTAKLRYTGLCPWATAGGSTAAMPADGQQALCAYSCCKATNNRHWRRDATAGTSAVALLTLSAVAIAVSVAVCRSKLQQLATADTLVTPDTVYKMYGVTQQQSCVQRQLITNYSQNIVNNAIHTTSTKCQ